MIPVSWTSLKEYVNARGISIQYTEDTVFYYLVAADSYSAFKAQISKTMPGDSADKTDFETNFQPTANRPTTSAFIDRTGSGSLTAQDVVVAANTQGMGSIVFNITGTWVGTIRAEYTVDAGATWNLMTGTDNSQSIFATTTVNDSFKLNCAGSAQVRLRMSAYTSGTAVVNWNAGQSINQIQAWNTNASSLKVAPRSDNINSTGTAGSLNADLVAAIDVGGYQSLEVTITGTWVGTVTFQGCDDNSTFVSASASNISNNLAGPVLTTTANGSFYVPLTFRYFRLRMTAYTSGTANCSHTFDTMTPTDLLPRNYLLTDGTNTAGITANTEIKMLDISNNGGTQAALTVGTSAVEVMVGGSPLANRKSCTLQNSSLVNIFWGYTNAVTTSTGTPIMVGQMYEWKVGTGTHIFVIAVGANNNTRITETA